MAARSSITNDAMVCLSEGIALAHQCGRHDLSRRLEAEQQRLIRPLPISLVVAGEAKRGKSSMINALLRRPDLLPVDVDICTGVHVTLRFGETEEAVVYLEEPDEERSIQISGLHEWISVQGNPGNRRHVRYVDVRLPDELLAQDLCVLDTPGVGGLDTAHARVTLLALTEADALIFVMDGSAPLSEPELAFLKRASERINTILFVLTKIDAYPGWRTILDENRALLAQATPRFAEAKVIPLSARQLFRSLDKAAAGDTAKAGRLESASGFPNLASLIITDVAGQEERLRAENASQIVSAAAVTLLSWESDLLESRAEDAARKTLIEQYSLTLKRADEQNSQWRQRLLDELADLEHRLSYEIQETGAMVRRRYEDRIGHWREDMLSSLPPEIASDLNVSTSDVGQKLELATVRLIKEVTEGAGIQLLDFQPASLDLPKRDPLQARPLPRQDMATRLKNARSLLSFLDGGGIAASIGGFLGLPVQGVGLVLAAITRGAERISWLRAGGQQEIRRLLSESIDQWQRDSAFALTQAVRKVRQTVEKQVQHLMNERLSTLRSQLDALKHESQQGDAGSRPDLESSEYRLQLLLGRCAALSASVRAER